MVNTLSTFRGLFPITKTRHYLNHAAVSPTSTRVRDAVSDWVGDLVNHGMANISDWVRCEREIRGLATKSQCAPNWNTRPTSIHGCIWPAVALSCGPSKQPTEA